MVLEGLAAKEAVDTWALMSVMMAIQAKGEFAADKGPAIEEHANLLLNRKLCVPGAKYNFLSLQKVVHELCIEILNAEIKTGG